MTSPLEHVLVAHAKDAFQSQEYLDTNWKLFKYSYCPDFKAACSESDRFIELLESCGATVDLLDAADCVSLDSLYVHDPVLTLPHGFGLCNMGKELRQKEPMAVASWLTSHGFEIAGRIQGAGKMEGGDVVWLKQDLAMIGVGYRTNQEGIRQLKNIINIPEFRLEPVFLPHWNGPGDVLHLMSILSPLDEKDLLVHSRLMPVVTRNRLLEEGFNLIEVPANEYNSMGCNVLSLGNRTCLLEQNNKETASLLRSNGFNVLTYDGSNISRPGEGGPTCLTRPLVRST